MRSAFIKRRDGRELEDLRAGIVNMRLNHMISMSEAADSQNLLFPFGIC
jgi:hypothetical protein